MRKLNVKSDKESIELDVKLSSLCGWGLSACEYVHGYREFLPSGRPVLLARDARFFQSVKAVELFIYLFSFTQQPIFLDRLNPTDYYFIFRALVLFSFDCGAVS